MKKQKGFSLVELMVVIAIIAILATAGISQYGKFIKSARDTARITDVATIGTVLQDYMSNVNHGVYPDTAAALGSAIKDAGKKIQDPYNGKPACLKADSTSQNCKYQYAVCDSGAGYILAVSFESANNIGRYSKDDVATTATTGIQTADLYEQGSCNAMTTSTGTASTLAEITYP